MNFVRIVSVLCVFASVASSTAQIANAPKGPPHHSSPIKPRSTDARMAEFSKKLSLTVDQKNKVTKIMNMHFERLKILAKNSKTSDSDRKVKIAADRALVNKQIRALLTAKQKMTFDAMLAEDAKQRQKMNQPPPKPSNN